MAHTAVGNVAIVTHDRNTEPRLEQGQIMVMESVDTPQGSRGARRHRALHKRRQCARRLALPRGPRGGAARRSGSRLRCPRASSTRSTIIRSASLSRLHPHRVHSVLSFSLLRSSPSSFHNSSSFSFSLLRSSPSSFHNSSSFFVIRNSSFFVILHRFISDARRHCSRPRLVGMVGGYHLLRVGRTMPAARRHLQHVSQRAGFADLRMVDVVLARVTRFGMPYIRQSPSRLPPLLKAHMHLTCRETPLGACKIE